MRVKSLKIKVRGVNRAVRDRLDHNAPPRPALVHAPIEVPVADAAPAPEEAQAVEQVIAQTAPPSPRDVADVVYKLFLEDARKARLRNRA